MSEPDVSVEPDEAERLRQLALRTYADDVQMERRAEGKIQHPFFGSNA